MAIFALLFAGTMRWFAKLQYRPEPRRMMNGVCLLAIGYAGYLFYYEPEQAWQVRWAGRLIAARALDLVNFLIP